MAIFYVAKNGNDANAGTLVSPKLTVSAALTASAAGDRISIRKGVYTDAWPFDKVFGRDIRSHEGEDVMIDCGGARASVSGQALNGSSVTTGTLTFRLVGLKFVNYTGTAFVSVAGPQLMVSSNLDLINCFFRPANNTTTRAINGNLMGSFTKGRLDGCTFKDHFRAVVQFVGPLLDIMRNTLFDGNTVNFDGADNGTEQINSVSATTEKNFNAYPGNTVETNGINTTTTAVGFNNAGAGDYSLSPTSSLRGAGKLGISIGASFNPRIFVDGEFADNLLSGGVNDSDWFNTGTSAPGPEGPADAGPAIFAGGVWKIDNASVPGAKSARVKFGPYTAPAGSRLRMPGWGALEDLAPASGSRQVVDFSAGTALREMQIVINGGTKQVFNKNSNIDQPAGTVAYFMTLRADGV